jgi:CRP-like cAMP-binding protein
MANNSARSPAARPPTDGDGVSVGSEILLSLPRNQRDQVLAKSEKVRLRLHQVLHEPGETIKSGYFINSGMISVVAIQPNGKSVEVAFIGKEGFVGLPLLEGYHTSPTRTITQGDATAYRCDAEAVRELVRQCPELGQQMHRFGHKLAMQSMQIAACNRLHEVEQRLARWIVMTQDRIVSDTLPLTQEFMGQMLGSRRSSVTVAAGVLQNAGLISYTRGSVTILNREKLEDAACGCYGAIQRQLKRWDAEVKLGPRLSK